MNVRSCQPCQTLDELGLAWRTVSPTLFGAQDVQGVSIVFASGTVLDTLQLLAPLTSARLVEVVRHGNDPMTDDFPVLRVPFAVSELEELIR